MMIPIKSQEEIELMHKSGQILASIIRQLKTLATPGTKTKEFDNLAQKLIKQNNVKPAFLGYGGFPGQVCISVNDEVVHGVPSDRTLVQGDMVSIDMGVIYEGWYSDSAVTVPVLGDMTPQDFKQHHPDKHKLIEVTREAINVGIKHIKPGRHIGDISAAIQSVIEPHGYGIVRELVGHGIGKALHEDPHVPNFGRSGEGPALKVGMVIAIEPMVTLGDWHVKLGEDRYTYKTVDGSDAAHFEHTVAITKQGPIVLTK